MTPDQIAEIVRSAMQERFGGQSAADVLGNARSQWTAEIKNTIGDLGILSGFEIASSGYPRAHQGEFLYDMVWYQIDGEGYSIFQPLVMEVEWATAPTGVVDDDFQKLVQARAGVRVWISTCANSADMEKHVENCRTQIDRFNGTQKGDQYVLVFFEWKNRSCDARIVTA